jgi:hypothetical protein
LSGIGKLKKKNKKKIGNENNSTTAKSTNLLNNNYSSATVAICSIDPSRIFSQRSIRHQALFKNSS